jgi:hypothetical protein
MRLGDGDLRDPGAAGAGGDVEDAGAIEGDRVETEAAACSIPASARQGPIPPRASLLKQT